MLHQLQMLEDGGTTVFGFCFAPEFLQDLRMKVGIHLVIFVFNDLQQLAEREYPTSYDIAFEGYDELARTDVLFVVIMEQYQLLPGHQDVIVLH